MIARDILFHLNTNHICTVLAAVHESKSKLLLTTSFPWLVENEDLPPRAEAYLGFAPQVHRLLCAASAYLRMDLYVTGPCMRCLRPVPKEWRICPACMHRRMGGIGSDFC